MSLDGDSEQLDYTIFHRYWISQSVLTPLKKKQYGNMKASIESGSSGSTVYKCRLVPDNPNIDYGKFYAMKVVSYIKTVVDKKNKEYRLVNPYAKSLQQIETEYLALQMLSKCHRVAKFKELIHENPKR